MSIESISKKLRKACKRSDFEEIKRFVILGNKLPISEKYEWGCNVGHVVCEAIDNNNEEVLCILIKNEVIITESMMEGIVSRGWVKPISLLSQSGKRASNVCAKLLELCVVYENTAVLNELILYWYLDDTLLNSYVLWEAVDKKRFKIIDFLIGIHKAFTRGHFITKLMCISIWRSDMEMQRHLMANHDVCLVDVITNYNYDRVRDTIATLADMSVGEYTRLYSGTDID